MGTKYVVTAPYVTFRAKDSAGGSILREMYQGGTLPDNADPNNVERLLEKKMIAEVGSQEADLLGVPAGSPIPGEPPNVPVTEQSPAYVDQQARLQRAQDAVDQADRTDQRGGRPRVNASKEDWVEYAVTQRAESVSEDDARVEAQALSKSDLIAKSGG